MLVTLRNALDQRRLRDENRSLKRAVEVAASDGRRQRRRCGRCWDADRARGADQRDRADLGRERRRQGARRARIHRNSLRSRERFVQVNCAAIPEELIESELFGHEKGSFTGATEKQIGKFEQADRGTIFLDEVGDMSAKTQAKVLRVLQEGEVERLGSARTIKVDVRVIAATNKNLEEEIEKGTFREDLYFRLSVIPIHVPPLRERPRGHPAARPALRGSVQPREQPRPQADHAGGARGAAAAPLEGQHPRAAEHRRAADHHDAGRHDRRRRSAATSCRVDAASVGCRQARRRTTATRPGTLREFKEAAERAFLVDKLRENGWNISKTAEVIDTPRSNLYKKLEQYQISQETDG